MLLMLLLLLLLLLVLLLLLLLLLVVVVVVHLPVVELAAVVQSVLPGRRRECVRVGDSVLVEETEERLVAEDVNMLLSVVRVAAGQVSQAGGVRRTAAVAAGAPTAPGFVAEKGLVHRCFPSGNWQREALTHS